MKQLVILSGKGGTGKTSLTAAFTHLTSQSRLAERIVLADADVDAANLELVLRPHLIEQEDFRGGQVAVIDGNTCASCGNYEAVCRFDTVDHADGLYAVDPIACDGCAACVYQYPSGNISMQEQVASKFYVSDSRYGPLYLASLYPGQETPANTKRILQTPKHFRLPALVCINKANIYLSDSKLIEAYCWDNDFEIADKIPFDETVTEAMVHGESVKAYRSDEPASQAIVEVWRSVLGSFSIQNIPSSLQELG